MRMIPSAPGPTSSSAELRLFERLAASKTDAICLHSLRLAEHEYKAEGEIDFLVLLPNGLLVVEVKGGGVTRSDDGIWTYTDRYGQRHHSSEGPMRQAASAMWSLRRYLLEHMPDIGRSGYTFGWVVAFPDATFKEVSPEWSQETVLDIDAVGVDAEPGASLATAMEHWRAQVGHATLPDRRTRERVLGLLRPRFDRAPTLATRSREVAQITARLTDEQYERLDIVSASPRIVCSGGAGTGKTFLALEIARRHAALGDRVTLLCPRPVLAAFARSRLGTGPEAERITVIDESGAAQAAAGDMLIVDEAQDILDESGLDMLDSLVTGGLAMGRWRIFLDHNVQAGLLGRFDQAALALLVEQAEPRMVLPLTRNCRNTSPIVTQVQLLTGADIGIPTAGEGPRVEIVSYEDEREAMQHLRRRLDNLMREEDVPLSEITVLSPLPWEHSAARLLPQHYLQHIIRLDPSTAALLPVESITFSTIVDFKGLENSFVLLIDVDRATGSADSVASLYVGMTRPRTSLWIAVSKDAEADLMTAVRERMQDAEVAPS